MAKHLCKFLLLSLICLPVFAEGQVALLESAPSKPAEFRDFFSFSLEYFNLIFFVRLLLNLLSMIILVRLIYYPVSGRRDFFFTFFMFNLIIFIIAILLNAQGSFSIGAAFGLFAIFAMLRYRTEDISARDMTYLFMSITIGLISSINMGTLLEISLINAIILLTAFLIEGNVFIKPEFAKVIEYENIDLIKPENHAELLSDLRNRTGLDIHRVFIKRIDFLRDTALIKIYYRSKEDRDA
jgi:hypothetical protein